MEISNLIDYAPAECLESEFDLGWWMTRAERFTLLYLLQRFKPETALEVGTFRGGSLQALARYSKHVVTIDIDPAFSLSERAKTFKNVSFEIGDSSEVLPRLIAAYAETLGFILIDGNHSAEYVRRDIDAVLQVVPRQPIALVCHDSFKPDCREGMRHAAWALSPHVHYVDLDFVPGCVLPHFDSIDSVMTGGFAFALLKPERRIDDLEIFESQLQQFNIVRRYAESAVASARPPIVLRGARRISRLLKRSFGERVGV
jgi:hypothetical protein